MNRRTTTWVRAGLSVSILVLAILRLAFFDEVGDRMDATFLLLLAAAAAAVLMPWERLTSLKAGGVEFSLELPQVRGAVQALGLDRVADERLKDQIERLNADIEKARGSRVLWIDDKPHEIVGERRLLRALGIQITMVTSSEMAMDFLARDNDFDLLITDVQRQGDSWEETGGVANSRGGELRDEAAKAPRWGHPISSRCLLRCLRLGSARRVHSTRARGRSAGTGHHQFGASIGGEDRRLARFGSGQSPRRRREEAADLLVSWCGAWVAIALELGLAPARWGAMMCRAPSTRH